MQEWHTISIGDKSFKIKIIRKSVLRFNLRVKSKDEIFISVPLSASRVAIESFLQEKSDWIASAVAKIQQRKQVIAIDDFDMQDRQITFLGNNLPVSIEKGRKDCVKLNSSNIMLQVKKIEIEHIKAVLTAFYKQKLQLIISHFIKDHIQNHKVFPQATITLRKMRSRWGSCNPNKCKITINSNLIYAQLSCIEYILTHEFVHFLCRGHCSIFYQKLTNYMPDWKERKKLLDSYAIL